MKKSFLYPLVFLGSLWIGYEAIQPAINDPKSYFLEHPMMKEQFSQSKLPPELLYVTFYYESQQRSKLEAVGEWILLQFHKNASYGIMQITLEGAATTTKLPYDSLEKIILNQEKNIELCEVYYLHALKQITKESTTKEALLQKPRMIAELLARYLGGNKYNYQKVLPEVKKRLKAFASKDFFPFPTKTNHRLYQLYLTTLYYEKKTKRFYMSTSK